MPSQKSTDKSAALDQIAATAHRQREQREKGYREKALKMYPWICGRCQREFTRDNVRELTVHHRNHDHDFNPEDGSNWELLCLFCHDNEHQRLLEAKGNDAASAIEPEKSAATHNPFAGLGTLLNSGRSDS
jgi:hypothetical protein